ncbi:MAG: hypothetical protein ACOC3V_02865 [bacterium]
MPTKSNFNTLKEKFTELYNHKYDYSKSNYINNRTKICIICPIHGDFYSTTYNHLRGTECPSCKPNLNMDNNSFINKSKKIHGNKYDYSLIDYKNNKTKVKIICIKHNHIFQQRPNDHLLGQGCILCKKDKLSSLKKYTKKIFLNKSKEIHGDKYDYSLVKYNGIDNKVNLICPEHGEFKQSPKNHMNGQGCTKCKNNKRLLNHDFINKSKLLHSNKYDYSLVEYKNNKTNIKIICPEHGEFKQKPIIHITGSGCPKCNQSKGEKMIMKFLNKSKILYVYQKKFENCKFKNVLKFDFYLPEYNTCIEYDGQQHFKINKFFGGEKEFKKTKIRDEIKNNFCEKNNISILRIPFDEFNNIDNILETNLK